MARDNKPKERKTGVAAWNEDAGIQTPSSEAAGTSHKKAEADRKRRMAYLIALAIVCVACLVCAWPIKNSIKRGLWLKEGTAAVMKADQDPSADISVISMRLGELSAYDAAVQMGENNEVLVEVPWFVDAKQTASIVGGTGHMDIVALNGVGDADALERINAGATDIVLEKGTYESLINEDSIKSATVQNYSDSVSMLTLSLDEKGAAEIEKLTSNENSSVGGMLLVVDGRYVSPVYQAGSNSELYVGMGISSNLANSIKALVDTGKLPVELTAAGTKKVPALIGKPAVWGLVGLAAAGFAAAVVLAWKKYRGLARVVAGALAVYAIFMLGLMALLSRVDMYVLTMPGVVAGFATACGTAVAAFALCGQFVQKVQSGSTIKGAALSSVRDGLYPFILPVSAIGAAAAILVFVPIWSAHDVGLTTVFGILSGLAGVCWYGITRLRMLAAGPIQDNPSAWVDMTGVKDSTEESS